MSLRHLPLVNFHCGTSTIRHSDEVLNESARYGPIQGFE